MKKLFVVLASIAMVACNNNDIQGEDGPNNNGGDNKVSGVVLNELSGADKFIELYNTTDAAINLDGIYLVKYDKNKEGGQSDG